VLTRASAGQMGHKHMGGRDAIACNFQAQKHGMDAIWNFPPRQPGEGGRKEAPSPPQALRLKWRNEDPAGHGKRAPRGRLPIELQLKRRAAPAALPPGGRRSSLCIGSCLQFLALLSESLVTEIGTGGRERPGTAGSQGSHPASPSAGPGRPGPREIKNQFPIAGLIDEPGQGRADPAHRYSKTL